MGTTDHKIVEEIRDALVAAQKAGDDPLKPIALLDASQFSKPEDYLAHLTETPSGKTYGAMTQHGAQRYLDTRGITVVDGEVDDYDAKRTFTVEIEVTGFMTVDVEATSPDEAREMVEDEYFLSDIDCDMEFTVFESKRTRRSAA